MPQTPMATATPNATLQRMLNGHDTTFDWQRHSGEICVLPVGSFEQHSHHLPLATDIIGAEYFARLIAEEFEAAVLPPLPFGTCMEHSGFRGSVGLRPETLMQIVRDVAEEIERQNFRVLILVNAHGGNFVLGPVARDINRRDGQLKVLLVNWWEYRDASIAADTSEQGLDIHAGEMETSLMMALRPELVREDQRAASDAPSQRNEEFPLEQRDLNTFGTGHFSSTGAIGFPSLASAEKGQAIIASVSERMLPHLRDRILRLRAQPEYSAHSAIVIRPMQLDDLEAGMRLKALAGWNQTEDDWRIFLREGSGPCFAAVHNGEIVGTTTTICYGNEQAWIGMVLVDPHFRRKGIAQKLLQCAFESLEDCDTIKLDATDLGQPLYARLGFVEEYSVRRMVHPCLPVMERSAQHPIRPIMDNFWDEIAALDRHVFGANREELLQTLRGHDSTAARCLIRDDEPVAFSLGRRGTNFYQVGPVVASGFEDARALIAAVFENLTSRAVLLDVPAGQSQFIEWLQSLGFFEQRSFRRMARGQSAPDQSEWQFAVTGPEFG